MRRCALDATGIEPLGVDHLYIPGRSFIVPFVAALPGRPGTVANPAEVSEVLHARGDQLLPDPPSSREERWTFPWAEDRPIFFFELVGDTV